MARINLLLLLLWLSAADAFFSLIRITPTCRRSSITITSTSSITSIGASIEDNEVEAAAAEAIFKKEIRELYNARNMGLAKVKNCRDLASVKNSSVKPKRIFRTGRLGDATAEDQELLFGEMGITTLVDLRSPTELKDDAALMADVFKEFTDLVWIENGRNKDGCVRELEPGVSPIDRRRFRKSSSSKIAEEEEFCDYGCDDPKSLPAGTFLETKKAPDRKERHFVSLMNEFKYVR